MVGLSRLELCSRVASFWAWQQDCSVCSFMACCHDSWTVMPKIWLQYCRIVMFGFNIWIIMLSNLASGLSYLWLLSRIVMFSIDRIRIVMFSIYRIRIVMFSIYRIRIVVFSIYRIRIIMFSIYRIMIVTFRVWLQDNAPLDCRRLFGWQSTNAVASEGMYCNSIRRYVLLQQQKVQLCSCE